MNFQSINYVMMVAKIRNFSKAAQELHITQQTLSAHIANVEKELGVKLFIRHNPLEITYAGQQFIKYSQPILTQLHTFYQVMDEVSNQERFKLTIGVTDNRDRILLSPIISAFQHRYPKSELQIIENPNEILIKELINNQLDLCISDFSINTPKIKQSPLYQENVVFVISNSLFMKQYPKSQQQILQKIHQNSDYHYLENFPILLGDNQDIAGRFAKSVLANFTTPPKIRVQAENMGLILRLVADGLGGCFCPEIIVRHTLSQEQLNNCLSIHLGKEADYKIQIGWKNNLKPIQEFVNIAKANTDNL